MRILAIDYGRARLGLAMSDEDEVPASPLPPHACRSTRSADLKFLQSLVRREKIGAIVVGHPLNMDGSVGEMAREAEEFAQELAESTRLPVQLVDERGTTLEADRVLREGRVAAKRRRSLRDGLAAVQILQSHLDQRSARSESVSRETNDRDSV